MTPTTPRIGDRGVAPCRVCRTEVVVEVIRPVSRGQTYFRCLTCSTVFHVPKRGEGRSG